MSSDATQTVTDSPPGADRAGAVPVSGEQFALQAGDYAAVVAGVGASLRSLTFRGRDLVVPFEADEVRPGFRGGTLAPWPNRIVDGRYTLDGVEHRPALSEPDRGHALHGLLGWTAYTLVDRGPAHVTLAATIEPQAGYPWRVTVETTYRLTAADGLEQSVAATNDSATAAPWGTGPHPYLVGGAGLVDDWTLALPAAEVLEVTPDRLAPTGLAAVDTDAARFDFRLPRRLGPVEIDHAFTALERDGAGIARVTVTDAAGGGVAMEWDRACPWVQIHTADVDGDPASPGYRVGLAVEPMTCAPDAYNDEAYPFDTGLIRIAPGAQHPRAWWRIRALA